MILNIIVKPYPELVDDYSILLKSPVSFNHTPGPFVNFVPKNLKRLSQNLYFKVHKYRLMDYSRKQTANSRYNKSIIFSTIGNNLNNFKHLRTLRTLNNLNNTFHVVQESKDNLN